MQPYPRDTRNPMFDAAFLMDYEMGEMSGDRLLRGFADGIKTGTVWLMQGSYGRMAATMITNGLITSAGDVTEKGEGVIEADNHLNG